MRKWFKYSLMLFGFVMFLSACVKETVPDTVNETIELGDDDSLILSGSFVTEGKSTSGQAEVYISDDSRKVVFKNFSTGNGPDVRVYLATDAQASDFINLGDLKATSGEFSYSLPNETDLSEYDHIVIWCEDFSLVFGYARLLE